MTPELKAMPGGHFLTICGILMLFVGVAWVMGSLVFDSKRSSSTGLASAPAILTGTWVGGFDCNGRSHKISMIFSGRPPQLSARVSVPTIGDALYRVFQSESSLNAVPERELLRIRPTTWLNIDAKVSGNSMTGTVARCGNLQLQKQSSETSTIQTFVAQPTQRVTLPLPNPPPLSAPVPIKVPSDDLASESRTEAEPYKIGGGVSAPSVVLKLEPEYSEEAREAKLQGEVLLSVVIDEKGDPHVVRVVRSLGMGLDEKATEAVLKWRFRPGLKDGRAVSVKAYVQVNFRLR